MEERLLRRSAPRNDSGERERRGATAGSVPTTNIWRASAVICGSFFLLHCIFP